MYVHFTKLLQGSSYKLCGYKNVIFSTKFLKKGLGLPTKWAKSGFNAPPPDLAFQIFLVQWYMIVFPDNQGEKRVPSTISACSGLGVSKLSLHIDIMDIWVSLTYLIKKITILSIVDKIFSKFKKILCKQTLLQSAVINCASKTCGWLYLA